jgi:leucyl-tRNA synthetase
MSLEDKFNALPEGIESEDVAELRRALMRVQKQLLQAKQRTDELVEVTHQAAHDATLAMGPITPVKAPELAKSKKKPEVALWHLTDWQGAKKTPSYNSQVMVERVMNFAEKAVKISDIMRADHPVNDCVIMFGGDMVEGLFNFPSQAFEIDATLFEQYVNVSKLLVDVVRYALTNYQKVTVVPEWGNHGRIGSKRDNVPRSDNLTVCVMS